MVEEDIQSGSHEKVNREQYDYIELWFLVAITSEHHHLLQQLLVSDYLNFWSFMLLCALKFIFQI